jgi:hypothetical protein
MSSLTNVKPSFKVSSFSTYCPLNVNNMSLFDNDVSNIRSEKLLKTIRVKEKSLLSVNEI